MNQQLQFPQSAFCSLTYEIMEDPVQDNKGFTYERSAIERWINEKGTNPHTRDPLSKEDLVKNRSLRDTIQSLKLQGATIDQSLIPSKNSYEYLCPELSISCIDFKESGSTKKSIVKMVTEKLNNPERDRNGIHAIFSLDISGSMTMGASPKDEPEEERTYFSRYDLLIHSVLAAVKLMNKKDKMTVFVYNSHAELLVDGVEMDESGKEYVKDKLTSKSPSGTTNIWDGLHKCLKKAETEEADGRLTNIIMLTDGEPTVRPPKGEEKMLDLYLDEYAEKYGQKYPFPVTMIGFGYSLNKDLLNYISKKTGGDFLFIPDASFMSTVVVNALANILSQWTNNLQITIEPKPGYQFSDSPINDIIDYVDFGSWRVYNLTGSNYGFNKILPLEFITDKDNKITDGFNITCKYLNPNINTFTNIPFQYLGEEYDNVDASYLGVYNAVPALEMAVDHAETRGYGNALNCIDELEHNVNSGNFSFNKSSKILEDFLYDLRGELKLGISSSDTYIKWGQFYMRSYINSIINLRCNNFKDLLVQNFGGETFEVLRDLTEQIYLSLDPPNESNKARVTCQYNTTAPVRNTPVNMQRFHNPHGGCFLPQSNVYMANGSKKQIKDIKKGDQLKCGLENIGTVECLLKILISNNYKIVYLEKENNQPLGISPWHPIYDDNQWKFPNTLRESEITNCTEVYSIMLQNGSSILIDGWVCASLGHGLTGEVIGHNFFGGTIRDTIKLKNGYENGLVTINSSDFKRDPINNLIIDF